jgi:hypothetical protein
MLVQGRSVEAAEPMRIVGEMARHPIKNDGETFAVACIDQRGKLGRRPEAAGGGEQAGRLITPGAVERVLANGQKLDMGKSQVTHVGRQLFRELAVTQPTASFVRSAAP